MPKKELELYQKKRDFDQSPEPDGEVSTLEVGGAPRFVVHMHDASRLHFDLRIEIDGVFKSWAVPKGPSLNPHDQRLAVRVEDHPLAYARFEGVIPAGNYGAGTVMIWDAGTYRARASEDQQRAEDLLRVGYDQGHMTFILYGYRLFGEFALIKSNDHEKNWLLLKKRDEYSDNHFDIRLLDRSVVTKRSLDEIAQQKLCQWLGKEGAQGALADPSIFFPPVQAPKKKLLQSKQIASTQPLPSFLVFDEGVKDPFPASIKPMVPQKISAPVGGSGWRFERPVSGKRVLVFVRKRGGVTAVSRFGRPLDLDRQIKDGLSSLESDGVLDGEISEGVFFVGDLLYWGNRDYRRAPLLQRRAVLEKLSFWGPSVILKPQLDAPEGLEGGWVAKDAGSSYTSGVSDRWCVYQPSEESPRLVISNSKKIYWPKEGITKGEVCRYYEEMSEYILPFLRDKPMSLHRHPHGIQREGFFQKDMVGYLPAFVETVSLYSRSSEKTIRYCLCQNRETLVYLANLGCIELNPWFARHHRPDHPDFFVFDIDPNGMSFRVVAEVAGCIHLILERRGVPHVCKTSGATGVHICVPTQGRYEFEVCRKFAEEVCGEVVKMDSRTSLERSPEKRVGKIYLDCLQNRRGQTLASVYSLRPREGAPVSMPLSWSELESLDRPESFHIGNAFERIDRAQELWGLLLSESADL